MDEEMPARFNPTLVVTPPFIFDTEGGVTAVDVSYSGRLPNRSGLVVVCFGGHPAAECLLDATGSGTDHEIVVAIDESRPHHRQFVLRLRGMVKPKKPIRVIPLPQGTTDV
jgi:hypothetical protein